MAEEDVEETPGEGPGEIAVAFNAEAVANDFPEAEPIDEEALRLSALADDGTGD